MRRATLMIHEGKNARTGRLGVEDLVESFDRGVPQLQNVVVRLRRAGGFELLAGYRSVQAAREMGWTHVEAKVVDVDDVTAETYQLEENLRRKALPNEAAAIARLVELHEQHSPARRGGDRRSVAFKGSKRQLAILKTPVGRVAKLLGQSERDVRRKVAVGRGAVPAVHAALREGKINILEAEKLSRLPAAEQSRRIAQPTGDREVKRALSALAFAERTLAGRTSVSEDLAAELRAQLDKLAVIARRLKTTKREGKALDVALAVDFTPKPANRKLSPIDMRPGRQRPHFTPRRPFVASTFTSIRATCPDSCVWKGAPSAPGGCYADSGFTSINSQRLDEAGHGADPDALIEAEAAAIDASFRGGRVPQDGAKGGRDLRLHVGGDITNAKQARVLGAASKRWRARGGGTVWTFTHSAHLVRRKAWGEAISVLASVERPEQIEVVLRAGYAAAIVVPDFPDEKAFRASAVT